MQTAAVATLAQQSVPLYGDMAHLARTGISAPIDLPILQEAGCDEVQGYLLARPMALPAFEAWYAEQA
jgi:EAL domain-containing protein (putative c-di-GMP-specific phosphodiesterase class I)